MSYFLYQLAIDKQPGQVVRINGPWDTWGYILSRQSSGFHLIRGLGHSKPPFEIYKKAKQ